jgi:hypothetical protein
LQLQYQYTSVTASSISSINTVLNLGVWLDNMMTLDHHINTVCRACYCNIKRLAHIRRYLTVQSARVLAAAIVGSRLDYCNSLLVGTSAAKINRLQRTQNYLARSVCRIPRRAHITPVLARLHWLPVKGRIDFKIALLTWKALYVNQPTYLSELLIRRGAVQTRALRNHDMLDVHRVTSRSGERAFCCSAPRIWNALPPTVTSASTLPLFKSRLKTHLFKQAFPAA